MRHTRTRSPFVALILFLFCAAQAPAQKKFCPAPPPSPFKHSGQIVTSFDRASGLRTTLEHPRPLPLPQGELYLSASFIHTDPRKGVQPTVELALVAASKVQRFRGVHEITLTSDGKPVPFGSNVRYQSGTGERGVALEVIRVTISQEALSSLTAARKVTGRIGTENFELTNNHLEALRELASLLSGSQPRWRTE